MNSQPPRRDGAARVAIVMGSSSDLRVMSQAAEVLENFEVPFELTIVSAHRTPQRLFEWSKAAHSRGIAVIIAGAGGAAHLPGMVAAMTVCPVVGVPVAGRHLDGLDSLLSIVQMPRGVPVATVAVDNATNAALLALQILAIGDGDLHTRLERYRDDRRQNVEADVAAIDAHGWRHLLGDRP